MVQHYASGPMERSSQSPKSRSGCQHCKNKRVKCDETKPECLVCIEDSIKCPGYGKPLRWSRKHELDPSSVATERPTTRRRLFAGASFRVEPKTTSLQKDMDTGAQYTSTSSMPSRELPELLSNATVLPLLEQMGLDLDVGDAYGMPDWVGFDCFSPYDNTTLCDHTMRGPVLESATSTGPSRHGMSVPIMGSSPGGREDESQNDTSKPFNNGSIPPRQGTEQLYYHGQTHGIVSKSQEVAALNQGTDDVQSTGSLLHTFYRLSLPSKVPDFSEMDFVCHYFKHVCRLYSCFDSKLNPFRTLVADRWSSCGTIFYAIQSMAVAHIANWYPYIAPLGLKKRTQAYQSLQQDLQLHRLGRFATDKVLLSLLLLGISSAWHHGSGLGIQQLNIARSIIQRHLRSMSRGIDTAALEEPEFYESALIYWEMLASFVDPIPIAPFPGHGFPTLRLPVLSEPVMPHPWTGLIPELHFVLAELGRLLRRWRGPESKIELQPNEDTNLEEADEQWAATLSRYLTTMKLPSKEHQVADYEDVHTTKLSLFRMTAAYRDIALLELYRLFPSLLTTASTVTSITESGVEGDCSTRASSNDPSGPMSELDSYTTSLAIQILESLEGIAITSGTCRLQPLVLLSAACQLRVLDVSGSAADEKRDEIIRLRYVAEGRLLELSRKFPQRPLQRMMDILKEVWSRLDTGSTRCHWMEVMYDREWQILMG